MTAHQCRPETCGGTHYDPCVAPWGNLGALLADVERLAGDFPSAVPSPILLQLVADHGHHDVVIGRVTARDPMGRAVDHEWFDPSDVVFQYGPEASA